MTSHRCDPSRSHSLHVRSPLLGAMLLVLLGLGCGSRTGLNEVLDGSPGVRSDGGADAGVDAGRDAGLDAGPIDVDGGPDFDAGTDAGPQDAGVDAGPMLTALCSPELVTIRPNEATTISGAAVPPAPGTTFSWSLVDAPPGAMPRFDVDGLNVRFLSSTEGRYEARLVVTAPMGAMAQCSAIIEVNNGEPAVRCPEDATILGGEAHELRGVATDDDGIAVHLWQIESGPPASSGTLLLPGAPVTSFLSRPGQDNAGPYVFRYTVTDTDGAQASCTTRVRVMAPPEIDCPTAPISAPTRIEVPINLSVREDRSLVSFDWNLTARPPASMGPFFTAQALNSARVIADRQGRYRVEYTVFDDDGLSDSCTFDVLGTPTPPTLMCPMTVETNPLVDTEIATTVVDDGDVLRFDWSLVDAPMGSAAAEPAPAAAVTRFTPDIAGEYTARLVVEDEDGMTASCDVLVQAVSDEGLRVEVTWDSMSDMDTHLLNPDAMRWDTSNDCFFRNCREAGGLDWGMPGVTEDNARLDIDNTTAFGPENINVDEPVPGVYTVGVHAFSGEANVTARVFCGGTRLTPAATFTIDNHGRGAYWRVADVTINADGTCNVVERMADDGGPDVISARAARTAR